MRHDSTMDPEHGPHGWADSLRVFDLDTSEASELFTFPAYEHSYEFSTGGGLILMSVEDVAGMGCYFAEQVLSTAVSVPVVPEQEGCGDGESCQWRCVALSPDASMVAFSGADTSSGGAIPSVRVVDTKSGEVVVALPGNASGSVRVVGSVWPPSPITWARGWPGRPSRWPFGMMG